MNILAKTTNGKNVVNGIFELFDSKGIPLYIIFEQCQQNNLMPSWIHFYIDAANHGWKHKTILNRLEAGMRDIYSEKFIKTVIERLD